jgi:two-component system, chemotaxis family, sensor kinase CheA
MVDAIRAMLSEIDATGQDGAEEYAGLMATLTKLQKPRAGAEPSADGAISAPASEAAEVSTQLQASAAQNEPTVMSRVSEESKRWPSPDKIGGVLVEHGLVSPEKIAQALEQQEQGDKRKLGDILVAQGHAKPEEVAVAQQVVEARSNVSSGTIRVGVNLLDNLMTLVGELVLVRNQLLQVSNSTDDVGLQSVSQRMNLIATELQEQVMKTRMQQIGTVWNQFPRTVRDVAFTCGKQVRIEMEGQETELDKTIIEAIKDPLTHIVRNSVDHGIETPERRSATGKPAEGRLLLRAYHEGGQVIIEMSDDGAGLDPEKLRRKALDKGLITAEQASRMGEREAANLIFLPGFSTAEKITNVSGRGVGMDVVKTNIEKIGGIVDVQSRLGAGTTVRMKIPLTLAIIPALIVSSGGDRYAIPQINLLELVRLDGEDAAKRVELIQGVPVYRLRGRLLPLVYLNRELRVVSTDAKCAEADSLNIVILQADDRQFGLVVDEINDTEEIVVKPLGKQLKGVKAFAGSTIMGDGRVALIIDVLGVAQASGVVGESRERSLAEKETHATGAGAEKQTMLLFQCGTEGCAAMDLSLVARLEEFKTSAIEKVGRQRVVQYRGQIMPLTWVSEALHLPPGPARTEPDTLQVVVYSAEGRSVGLVVDQILDIVEERIVAEQPTKRDGVLGSAIIQQRVTDLLDVHALVRSAAPPAGAGTKMEELSA